MIFSSLILNRVHYILLKSASYINKLQYFWTS